MITSFQRYFGKHFKWVLLAFLCVLLFSFIVSIGAVPRMSQAMASTSAQMFLGVDLSDKQEMQSLANDVQFAYQNLYSRQISSNQELQSLVLQRIVLMHLADEWHIPTPTAKQLEAYLRSARAFRDTDGHFSNDLYLKFKDAVDNNPPAQSAAITAMLMEDCRLDRVRDLLTGPGYVAPALAQFQVAIGEAKSDLAVGSLDYKSFQPKLDLTGDKLTAALQDMFNKDPSQFQLPASATLSYVKFAAPTTLTPTDAQLKDFLTQNKTTYPDMVADKLTDKDKTTLTDAWRKEQAQDQTMAYAKELFALKTKPGTPAFDALLSKYKVKLQTLPTVVQGKPAPADSPIPDDILQQVAFSLSPDQSFAPVQLDDGAAVVFLLQSTPPQAATFAQVRDDVLKAYTDSEKMSQFNAKCTAIHDAIVKAMAGGTTFADAAKAQGLDVKTFADVSYNDLRDTLMAMPFDASDKTTPMPKGPLVAMGRDAMTALATSDSSGTPMLATLRLGTPSIMENVGDTAVIFDATKREAVQVAVDSPDVQRMLLMLKDQESYYSANYAIDSIIQQTQATTKPTGS